jgi:hypothetical protein
VGLEHDLQFAFLVRVSPQLKFVGAKHRLFPFLVLDIVAYRCLADVSHAPRVVGARPQGGQAAAQERKLLSQYAAGVAFESIGDLGDRKGRVTLNEQMNVIRHDFHRVNRQSKLVSLLAEQRFQAIGNSALKHRPAVLRAPNQIKPRASKRPKRFLRNVSPGKVYTEQAYNAITD